MNFTGRHYSLNKGNIIATVTELSREAELTEIIAEEHSPNFEDGVIINNINRLEMTRQIKEMLKAKLIQPSNSSWSAPLFCSKKKDGSL